MNPLPKSVGVLAILAAIFGALNSADVLTVIGPKLGSLVALISTIVGALSHSLTGTGGKPQ